MFLILFGADTYSQIPVTFFANFSDDPVQTHALYQEISEHSNQYKEAQIGKILKNLIRGALIIKNVTKLWKSP